MINQDFKKYLRWFILFPLFFFCFSCSDSDTEEDLVVDLNFSIVDFKPQTIGKVNQDFKILLDKSIDYQGEVEIEFFGNNENIKVTVVEDLRDRRISLSSLPEGVKSGTFTVSVDTVTVTSQDLLVILPIITDGPRSEFLTGDTIVLKGKNFLWENYETAVLFEGARFLDYAELKGTIVELNDTLIEVIIPNKINSSSNLYVKTGAHSSEVFYLNGTLNPGISYLSTTSAEYFPGSKLYIFGSNFGFGEGLSFYLGDYQLQIGTGRTGSNQGYSGMSVYIPSDIPEGVYPLLIYNSIKYPEYPGVGPDIKVVNFPDLEINALEGKEGELIRISGYDFTKPEDVYVQYKWFDEETRQIKYIAPPFTIGSAFLEFNVPAGLPVGKETTLSVSGTMPVTNWQFVVNK